MAIGPRRKQIPTENVYPAVPPRSYVFWTWMGLAAVLFGISFLLPAPPRVPLHLYEAEFAVVIVLALGLAWVALFSASHRVEIVKATLRIHGGLFHRTVQAADLDIAGARIVDFTRESQGAPLWRLYGASLPGYNVGFYWLRQAGFGWVVITDPRSVLWLPVKGGKPFLLSLADNAGLLARLQKYASRPAAAGEK